VTYRALRQAIFGLVTLSAVALVLSTGGVGETFAIFNAETQNAGSVFAGGWIDPPASVVVTPSGYDVGFAWTPGTHGPVTGQKLNGVDNAANPSCSGASVVLLATMASTSTATYTDSSRATPLTNGHWFCYQLVSTSATAWTGVYNAAVQIGLATTAISIANGTVSTNNSVDVGDKITLTFNQKTNLAASGTKKVCVVAPSTIILGDTTGGTSCAAGDAFNVGKITGVTVASTQPFATSTFTTSTTAPWTMTITLAGTGTASAASGTATFVPSATIQSNASTHRAVLCTTADSTCQPTTATHF
jgi:hypothetical protein